MAHETIIAKAESRRRGTDLIAVGREVLPALQPMPLYPCAVDLEVRAEHLEGVLKAVSRYVAEILDDVAQNVPGGLDQRQIDALLSDLISEVTGTLRRAADSLPLPGRRS